MGKIGVHIRCEEKESPWVQAFGSGGGAVVALLSVPPRATAFPSPAAKCPDPSGAVFSIVHWLGWNVGLTCGGHCMLALKPCVRLKPECRVWDSMLIRTWHMVLEPVHRVGPTAEPPAPLWLDQVPGPARSELGLHCEGPSGSLQPCHS